MIRTPELFPKFKQLLWEAFDVHEQNNGIKYGAEEYYNLYMNEDHDIVLLAALVTVLNHKCWYWYDNGNEKLSAIYSDLYYKYNDKVWAWLDKDGTEKEKSWYFHTMD